MLPVVAVSAVAGGAASLLLHRKQQNCVKAKPQRRFKVRLADNTETPFEHLQRPSAIWNAQSADIANQAADSGQHSVNTPTKQHAAGLEQPAAGMAVATVEQQHPYAAQLQELLAHPRCPTFLSQTAASPAAEAHAAAHDTVKNGMTNKSSAAAAAAGAATAAGAGLAAHPLAALAALVGLRPPPPPLSETRLSMVDSPKALQAMLQELQGVACVGLDTEHSSHRSYLGLTCLLQLSTGAVDYLIDCLALHDQLGLLRPFLADPAVVKVLHGAANDVLWLQRDAHIYLVNIFDTEKAALVLGKKERSLASLLRRYCGVQQNKAYQTADWFVRPLPPVLQQYVRSDVHWLPYLAGRLVAELQARSPSTNGDLSAAGPLLTSALQKSNSLCLKLYHKTPAAVAVSNSLAAAVRRYTHQQQQAAAAWLSCSLGPRGAPVVAAAAVSGGANSSTPAAAVGGAGANGAWSAFAGIDQLHLMAVRSRLAQLITWRDTAARADDEGPQYILPDAAMLALADRPPATAKELLSLVKVHVNTLNTAVQHLPCAPKWAVSAAVQKSARQLVQLLQQATSGYHCDSCQDPPGCQDCCQASSGQTTVNSQQPDAASCSSGSSFALAGAAGQQQQRHERLNGLHAANEATAAAAVATAASAGPAVVVGGVLVSAGAARSRGLNVPGHMMGGPGQQAGRRKRREEDGEFRQRLIKKFSAKTQVYDNCRMLSTTGELLCFCDMRKLQWYIDKGLAEKVEEDPPTIRLLFEHKNADQQVGLDGFYSTSRANRCVVCGQEQHYLRYRVVPACYRRCFPAHLKSHRSHDIVLLCIDCHQAAHKAAEAMKRQVAEQYGIPLRPLQALKQQMAVENRHGTPAAAAAAVDDSTGSDGQDEGESADPSPPQQQQQQQLMSCYKGGVAMPVSSALLAHQARAAAIALLRFDGSLPAARKLQLQDVVTRFMGRDPAAGPVSVSREDIEAALVAGLGNKARAKTLQKMRKHLQQSQQSPKTGSSRCAEKSAEAVAEAAPETGGEEYEEEDTADVDAAGNSCMGPSSTDAGIINSVTSGPVLSRSVTSGPAPSLAELGHAWHGQQVVAAALAQGGEEALHQLVRQFRRAFVLACRPRFLPKAWDVNAVDTRQFGDYSVYAREEAAAAAAAEASQAEGSSSSSSSGDEEGDEGGVAGVVGLLGEERREQLSIFSRS